MEKPTVEDYMKLIAELTGYSNQSTRVSMGYMPSRKYNDFGESEGLNYADWGWVVETKLFSQENVEFSAQAKDSLIEALHNLSIQIVTHLNGIKNRWTNSHQTAASKLAAFKDRFST